MRVFSNEVAPRADRPATALLHDEANARIVAFHLRPGQRLMPHRSDATVIVQVVDGAGTFHGEGIDALLGPGEIAVFAPGELHAVEAEAVPLQFVAVVAPRPGE